MTDIESSVSSVLTEMHDVAATPSGLVAVGCEKPALECTAGKAWRSDTGSAWELLGDLPMRSPKAVGSVGETLVVVGLSRSDADKAKGLSATSADGGATWTLEPTVISRPGGLHDLAPHDDEFLLSASTRGRPAAGMRRGSSAPPTAPSGRVSGPQS